MVEERGKHEAGVEVLERDVRLVVTCRQNFVT